MHQGRSYRLVHYANGPAARLYAIRLLDRQGDELADFLDREENAVCSKDEAARCKYKFCSRRRYCQRPDYFAKIAEKLDWAVQEVGFDSSFFSRNRNYPFPLDALSFGPYRLYGMLYGKELFIAGNGGPKFEKSISDEPLVKPHYAIVRAVAQNLSVRISHLPKAQLPRDGSGKLYLPNELLSESTF